MLVIFVMAVVLHLRTKVGDISEKAPGSNFIAKEILLG
jgi:hypothetical protein